MGDRRFYVVGKDGHFIGVKEIDCATDSEAVERLLDGTIWRFGNKAV
jgi:hypothetical protein